MALLRDQGDKALLTRYSSFMTVENTLSQVVELLLKNDRLKRLLYYTDPKALHLPKLTPAQSLSLVNDQIRIIPKLGTEVDVKPHIVLTFDKFIPTDDMTAFRSCVLGVDITVPYDYWNLENFKLRPYAIAGEVDAMLNKSNQTRLGIADFAGARMLIVNSEVGGLSLSYTIETFTDDIKLHPEER